MPMQLPNLDDRRFADLVEEGKRLIPGLAPSWTDHNPSDPGITFIELFAYLTEMLMYRANRVTDANKHAFVKLLRGDPAWPFTKPVDEEMRLAVLDLRVEERAVTPKDFERLAKNFVGVARAYCLPRRNVDATGPTTEAPGHVSVIIVPAREQTGFPIAAQALKDYVFNGNDKDNVKGLASRCLLTTRLHVASAQFVKVGVRLTVKIFPDRTGDIVKTRVIDTLTNYFSPLDGGPKGKGWPLGQAVYVSDLYALLDQVDGVDFVERSGTDLEELFIDSPSRAIPDARRLPADRTKPLAGVRLEPDELVTFLETESATSITVERQATDIPR